jgi:hypothetical protein
MGVFHYIPVLIVKREREILSITTGRVAHVIQLSPAENKMFFRFLGFFLLLLLVLQELDCIFVEVDIFLFFCFCCW